VPATAQASAFIDVNCERVRIDYHQWPSGPPDSSHTSVRVDGGIRFDEVVSFSGSTFGVEVPLNLNDGKEHTIEAKHDWINHEAGSKEVTETLTCGSPPPATDQPPPQEQSPAPPPEQPPASPPAPAAPPPPTAAAGAPPAPTSSPLARPLSTAERAAQRRKARRHRQRAEARRERRRARHRATSHRAPRNPG
jgi:hypothetical protein